VKKTFRWTQPPTKAYAADRYIIALDRAVGDLLMFWAAKVEAAAKVGASWTDRTGNARQTLAAFAVKITRRQPVQAVMITVGERLVPVSYNPGIGGWALILRHGVSYGKWLEIARQGRYAIVEPTLDSHSNLIWNSVKALVK
jgi:hypothetical protein